MATDAATPAATALRFDPPNVKYIATAPNAAAGTSLIGETSIARNAGLVAISQAAASPTPSECNLRPIKNVIHTRSAPVIGTIQNMAQWPATALAAAIMRERPGAVIGTSAEPDAAGRKP